MLHKYLQWTLPVLSILLSHPAMVVGGQFDSWWDSVTNCPECSASAVSLYGYGYSSRGDLLALPTEKMEMVRQFPFPPSGSGDSLVQCAEPTPSELNQGDVNKAAEWVKKSILDGGGRVNDDSGSDHQVVAADQIDLNNPTEMVELAKRGARAMVVDTSNTMGVV